MDLEEIELRPVFAEAAGQPRRDRHAGELHGAVRRRRRKGGRAGKAHRQEDGHGEVLRRFRPDLSAQAGQPRAGRALRRRPERLQIRAGSAACCSPSARWRSPLRRTRSAPRPWPTSAIPCARERICALSRHVMALTQDASDDRRHPVVRAHAGRQRQPPAFAARGVPGHATRCWSCTPTSPSGMVVYPAMIAKRVNGEPALHGHRGHPHGGRAPGRRPAGDCTSASASIRRPRPRA